MRMRPENPQSTADRKRTPRDPSQGLAPGQAPAPADACRPAGALRIERAAAPDLVLGQHEFAITTYQLAIQEALLLAPTTICCWGPGQGIPRSVGYGVATYAFGGGVVFSSEPSDATKQERG